MAQNYDTLTDMCIFPLNQHCIFQFKGYMVLNKRMMMSTQIMNGNSE